MFDRFGNLQVTQPNKTAGYYNYNPTDHLSSNRDFNRYNAETYKTNNGAFSDFYKKHGF